MKIPEKNNIIELYNDGYSSGDIAKIFRLNAQTILNYLHKNNISIRDCNDPSYFDRRKINMFDREFFYTPSDKLYYMMGFILGDGNLSINKKEGRYRLTITVQKSDNYVLNMFCDWLKCENSAVKYSNITQRCDLLLRDCIFKDNEHFSKFGLISNKTYNPLIPIIDDSFLIYFLIGLIDADGHVEFSVKPSRYRIELVGNKIIMNWFRDSIIKLGFKGKINEYYKDHLVWSRISIHKKSDVIELAKILKINKCLFCMDRKWSSIKNKLHHSIE